MNEIIYRWIPEEKRVDMNASEKLATDCGGLGYIDGIDIERGITMTGGSAESYRGVLALFCNDVAGRLDILKQTPDERNLKLFTTQVHALKSASASIGAPALSERAAFLEKAGLSGDMDAIRERLDDFCTELETLVQNIGDALSERAGELPISEANLDADVLIRLKGALEEDNIGMIDAITHELSVKSYDAKTQAGISKLSEYILLSDFEEAIHLIDNLLREA